MGVTNPKCRFEVTTRLRVHPKTGTVGYVHRYAPTHPTIATTPNGSYNVDGADVDTRCPPEPGGPADVSLPIEREPAAYHARTSTIAIVQDGYPGS